MAFYSKHVFICTNQKDEGKKCCAQAGAEDIWDYFKNQLKDKGMFGPGKIRVSRSGCLGRCAIGPCLVIYPDNIWFTYTSRDDIDAIISEYLQKGNIISRLLLDQSHTNE